MLKSKFELFEIICNELRTRDERIITESAFSPEQLEELKGEYEVPTEQAALREALKDVDAHFTSKGSSTPFKYDLKTGRFWKKDPDYIKFISDARSVRGTGLPAAKWFEIQACDRLSRRLTGGLHLVGFPRKKRRTRVEYLTYLKKLGFSHDCLEPMDKDGGFDIIWFPPLGAIPINPVVSLQCKNSSFDRDEAFKSAGQAERSIHRHTNMRAPGTYMLGVIFNDYIDQSFEGKACGWNFVPLGLSDLALSRNGIYTESLS